MAEAARPDQQSRRVPPKVLVANPSADLYGSDRMMLEAVRGFTTQGWAVTVTCSQPGPLLEPLRTLGAEVLVEPVPVVRKSMRSAKGLLTLMGRTVTALPRLRRLIRRERPSVILVNTVTVPIWSLAARLTRVPVVVHVHEAEASAGRASRFALTAPLVLADRVVFNSDVSRGVSGSALLERLGKARVVHNGVRGPDSVEPAREELSPPFRLVYVGRLSPRKGVDLVISAVDVLRGDGIVAQLDLVGSVFPGYEWYERELRELIARLDLQERVRFQGFQSSVWSFLAEADVALTPSRLDESFGNTVIEALMAARPVVVSDHTGLREAAAGFEAAVAVRTDSVTALSDALRRIHQDWPEYRERALRDSSRATRRYGPEPFHAALADVLLEVSKRGEVDHPSRHAVRD